MWISGAISKRINDSELGETGKLAVHRIEFRDAVPETKGRYMFVHQVASCRRFAEPFNSFQCVFFCIGLRKQFRMRDYPEKLIDARPGYCPWVPTLRQRRRLGQCRAIIRRLFTYRMDQNICLDRDQPMPSIRPYSRSRFSSTLSDTSILPRGRGSSLSLKGFCGCGPAS